MNQTYAKKLLVSSLALALLIGGSHYAVPAHAQETTGVTQTDSGSPHSGGAPYTHKGKQWPIIEESAKLIGVDKAALEKSLKEGKSIVEAAAEKGVSEADLTAKLQSLRNSRIDEAVKSGKLSADKAEHMKKRLAEHLKCVLNEKQLLDKMERRGHKHGHHGLKPDADKLAKSLGLSKEELSAQLKAGKSLAEIAEAKGVSRDKLVSTIKEQLTPSIEKMVDHKKNTEKSK